MGHFGGHFVFAYILNCSTLTKFQFSVWSSAMPKETEAIKKNLIPQNKVRPQIWVWLPDYGWYLNPWVVTGFWNRLPHQAGIRYSNTSNEISVRLVTNYGDYIYERGKFHDHSALFSNFFLVV